MTQPRRPICPKSANLGHCLRSQFGELADCRRLLRSRFAYPAQKTSVARADLGQVGLRWAWLLGLALTPLFTSVADEISTEQREFFESKIRPIFVDHCYGCHSVDADEVEGGLLLDSRWGWETGGDSGPAIVPNNPEESLVIHAVGYEEDVVSAMPPKSKLSTKKINLLRQWIEMGAPDPREKATQSSEKMVEAFDLQKRVQEHWSWRPVTKPAVPKVGDEAWPISDLDRFVLAKIEAANLRPAADASRRSWIRRVYFDLIGLPPTTQQIQQFLNDDSPQAYQEVVSQLLRSHHFGEKWARHWMDLVRYAETYGHEFDYPITSAHEYRDYLIRAFNADVPYDQLVREHIAGDLLAQPRRHPTEDFNESIIGTGFWYFHEATHAPTDVLGNEADIIDNQLDVFGKTFLGLTIACARCHDHKFDAISTADYYALSAYIQSSCRQRYPLDPGRRIEKATERIRDLRSSAQDHLHGVRIDDQRLDPTGYYRAAATLLQRASDSSLDDNALPDDWIKEVAHHRDLDWERLKKWIELLTSVDSAAKPTGPAAVLALTIKDPGALAEVTRRANNEARGRTEFHDRSELFADFDGEKLPDGWSTSGPAFAATGNRFGVSADGKAHHRPGTVDSSILGPKQAGILRSPTFEITARNIHVRMRATANVSCNVIIDNYQMMPFNGLLFNGTFFKGGASDTKGQWQWKSFGGDLNKYVGHKAYLEFIDEGDATIAIDEIRFSDHGAPRKSIDRLAVDLAGGEGSLQRLWKRSLAHWNEGKHDALLAWLVNHDLVSIADIDSAASESIAQAGELAEQLPAPRFVVAMAEGTAEEANVYVRGSHTNLGEKVPRRFLTALGSKQGGRLQLADRIANPDNPLTSRVIVNRLWHHLFGRGIVPTVDDFGPQGQPASHRELLDWLASEFVESDWSIKKATEKMVLSRTYRQSSLPHPDLDRDMIATVDPTNRLLYRMRVRRLPAESIRDAILAVSGRLDPKPFGASVPTHRTEFMTGRGARGSGPLDGSGRRSVYLSIYRNFLNPFLLTFDMPSPFGPKGRRSTSNVPAQALTLMNDPFVTGQAELWAEQIRKDPRPDHQRIAAMVEQAHGFPPTDNQLDALTDFLHRQSEQYGKADRAWTDLAHALLNMKAFYYLR